MVTVPPNLPGLISSINPKIDVGGAIKVFDFAWLFGVRLTFFHSSHGWPRLSFSSQFCVSLVVYSILSLAFPAQETFIPEAITSDSEHDRDVEVDSEQASQIEKNSVQAEVKAVV